MKHMCLGVIYIYEETRLVVRVGVEYQVGNRCHRAKLLVAFVLSSASCLFVKIVIVEPASITI